MNNALVAFPFVFFALFIVFMLVTLFGSTFVRYFHFIDKRGLLTAESWEKVNVLMANGDFSMYSSEGFEPGKRYNRISVGYERKSGESKTSVSNSFKDDDINKMVNDAFDWATNEGYINAKQD